LNRNELPPADGCVLAKKGAGHVASALLTEPDFPAIRAAIEAYWQGKGAKGAAGFQALHDLLDHPSQHVWITFEDGYMWWCTVRDGAHPNETGESSTKGNFWLNCERPWSNESLRGRLLTTTDTWRCDAGAGLQGNSL
jgi:hypothetical protein